MQASLVSIEQVVVGLCLLVPWDDNDNIAFSSSISESFVVVSRVYEYSLHSASIQPLSYCAPMVFYIYLIVRRSFEGNGRNSRV